MFLDALPLPLDRFCAPALQSGADEAARDAAAEALVCYRRKGNRASTQVG